MRRSLWTGSVAALALAVAALAVFWPGGKSGHPSSGSSGPEASLLPAAPEYYSLLAGASNPRRLLLATSFGLNESTDGGRTWQPGALSGKPTLALVRAGRTTCA